VDHGVLWPNEHGEELAGELERGRAHQARRLFAHPHKQVGVGVEDVDILGVEQLLLQLVSRHLHLKSGFLLLSLKRQKRTEPTPSFLSFLNFNPKVFFSLQNYQVMRFGDDNDNLPTYLYIYSL